MLADIKKLAYVWFIGYPAWKGGWIAFWFAQKFYAASWVLWNKSYVWREKVGVFSRPAKEMHTGDGIDGNGTTFP